MESFLSHTIRKMHKAHRGSSSSTCRQSVLCVALLTATAIVFSFAAVAASWSLFTEAFKLMRVH
jgi:hypothetical protein